MTLNMQCILYTRLSAAETHQFQRFHITPKIQYCQKHHRKYYGGKNKTI